MSHDAKKGLQVTGQEVSAGSGSTAANVPQPGPHITPDEFVALWAEARTAFYADEFPPYGSKAWRALRPDDPRRLAGALDAAEKWRKYGDEDALFTWFRSVVGRSFKADARTHAELVARRAAPHAADCDCPACTACHIGANLHATPGWPPIRIPGGGGRYLTYDEGRAAA
ncbi:hypothetical protein [Streptomyces virginiae]|uniref:hypothetical protein n=1 Tax=Streptomyces virginiae TaxID=1961 RepID=UPI0036493D73